METKHTKGEWRKGTYSGVVGCPIMAQPDKTKNQFNICSVHGGANIDEVNANAKLISAAPDLLAACQALLTMMNRTEPKKFEENLTWRQNDEKAKSMAIAAISKATT